MHRFIAMVAAMALLIGIPAGTAIAANPQSTDASGEAPVTLQGGAVCDIMVSVHGGPLTDGNVTLRVGQDLGVFGSGFPGSKTINIDFSFAGSVEQWETTTTPAGAFEEHFEFFGDDPPAPEAWVLTVYDPTNAAGCSDTLTISLIKSTPFTDIGGNPFRADIVWLFHEGITGGCTATRFCPKDPVTREQMASFLDRALDLPTTNVDFFTDDNQSIHQGAINRLAAAGITGGCASGRFCPRDPVFRDQMASFLDRSLDLPTTNIDFFTDDNRSMHQGAINRLAAAGITGGCHPTVAWYCPKLSVTREQMAAFLHRGLTR